MRAFDRDPIRGGHYGQRSCEPRLKAEHMAAPTKPCDVKILLANSDPSTHGSMTRTMRGDRTSGGMASPAEPRFFAAELLFDHGIRHCREFLDVGAGAERPLARSGQHRHADSGIVGKLAHERIQGASCL